MLRHPCRERTGEERWAEPLDASELAHPRRHWCRTSLRYLRRLDQQIVTARDQFATRH